MDAREVRVLTRIRFVRRRGGRFQRILPKAYAWLDQHQNEKFLLFLHTYNIHSEHPTKLPYSCPGGLEPGYVDRQTATFDGCREEKCATELLGWVNSQVRIAGASAADFFTPEEIEFISSLYDGCINYFDKKIAGLVGDLKARGISDRTMIVITSDHGEEFAEHGMFLHDQGGYEEYAWHPLIVKFSESRFGGHRVPHWGAVVDIMPTVLDVLGIPVNQQAQGFILLPAVTSDAPVRYDVQMYDVLKTGSRKYFSSKKLLFDVEADPRELDSLFAEQPQVVAELETRLRTLIGADIAAFDSLQASITTPSGGVELSAEEIENLKALGYLTD